MTWRDQETARSLARIRSGEPPSVPSSRRLPALDSARGAALLLMFWSHAGIVLGFPSPQGWGFWLFVTISGSLWRGRPLGRRYAQVVIAAVISAPLTWWAGLNALNVLVAWSLLGPLLRWFDRVGAFPTVAIAGVLMVEWPLAGVNPGLVLLGWQLGHAVGSTDMARSARGLPEAAWLRVLGRWPLTAFVLHAAVLAAAAGR